MSCKILLTSFQTWLPHQRSNSSDDLVQTILAERDDFQSQSISLMGLRHLPVDVMPAAELVKAKIAELQPHAIICCGMAEKRTQLTLESCATSPYLSFDPVGVIAFKKFLTLKSLMSLVSAPFSIPKLEDRTVIQTSLNLEALIRDLAQTEISHDAGKFVCEGLYYQVLQYLETQPLKIGCIFVHVPVLNAENLPTILTDFRVIIQRVASLSPANGT